MSNTTKESYYRVYVYDGEFHSTYQLQTLNEVNKLVKKLGKDKIEGIYRHINETIKLEFS